MPDHPHPPRAAEERISDETLEMLIDDPGIALGDEIQRALRELQSRRAAPERAAVIEECAGLLDLTGQQIRLIAGEMGAQEMRTVRAMLNNRASILRALAKPQAQENT